MTNLMGRVKKTHCGDPNLILQGIDFFINMNCLDLIYTMFTIIQTFVDSWWIRKRFKTFLDSVHASMLEIVSDWGQSSMKTKQKGSVKTCKNLKVF